jgi:hypothetical protein
VRRGEQSMTTLEKITGLVIAAIVTIINESVFDDDAAGWQRYSGAFNLLDLVMIIYLCYFSPWVLAILGRWGSRRVKIEPRLTGTRLAFQPIKLAKNGS